MQTIFKSCNRVKSATERTWRRVRRVAGLSRLAVVVLAAAGVLIAATPAAAQSEQASESDGRPFRLNLPEWNPDPESLPPELRPLDVVRPVLTDDVAVQVAELEARIAEIEGLWLEAETREAQDVLLDEAIGYAERVLAMREEHQGNTDDLIRWRDAAGEPSKWHEVIVARQKIADLRLMRGLNDEDRAELASITGTVAEYDRLYGEGRYAEAQAVTERQLAVRRRVLGDEHPDTLTSINNIGVLLWSQGRLSEAEPYFREALTTAERLRVDIAGDASARAQFAGALNLTGIAAGYTRTLLGLNRDAEALGVLERGRGRAGLDLFAGGRSAAEQALRTTADAAA